MADILTSAERSERMRLVHSKDTKLEMAVRSLVHAKGYRFRLHRKDLPGKPDLVFPSRRKVIFIHGCFWHMHPDPNCKLARMPKSRLEYWQPKLDGNRQRDEANQASLRELGWAVMVIWECEIADRDRLACKIISFLESTE